MSNEFSVRVTEVDDLGGRGIYSVTVRHNSRDSQQQNAPSSTIDYGTTVV